MADLIKILLFIFAKNVILDKLELREPGGGKEQDKAGSCSLTSNLVS